ncbi:MAG: AcrB/AcrD/AcrF family protein [Proteobacteria bacterium]|nr:AcrB/AcrD/AcrF family protein [Pseudomonadota bacterium]
MRELIATCVERSRTMALILVLIFVAGIYAYIAIPKESEPDIPIPIIYVSMHHEGISPEDAVSMLIKPMEVELRSIAGLDELEATAYEGGANVLMKFEAGFDNKRALDDVRAKVDIAKADLPDETDEPTITEVNVSDFPILTVILSGQLPERALKRIAETLQDYLESVPGVLEAKVVGAREEQVVLEIDRAKLESYGITLQDMYNAVSLGNKLVAAGSLEMGSSRYPVKIPGLFRTPQELLDLPVYADDQRTVLVRDIAEVKPTFKDATAVTRVNGKPAITLEIRKRIGANIISTVDGIKYVVDTFMKQAPEGLSVSYTGDKSVGIARMLNDLQNNVLIAIFLVMVVLIAAMGIRPALLVAFAIPGSFLLGILVLFSTGLTANIVVLFSLILSVGMLVDGAIVVVELADQRLQAGDSRKDAYVYAAQYMAWPIIASTATTLAAFMPLIAWPGIVGEFMKFLPITLIYTLLASLLMALLFLPMVGARFGGVSKYAVPIANSALINWYTRKLEAAIAAPGKVLRYMIVMFVGSIVLYGFLGRGVEFFPNVEPERVQLKVHAAGDYSLNEQDSMMKEVEARILDLPEIKTFYVVTGQNSRQGDAAEDQIGTVTMELKDWEDRDRTADEVLADVMGRTADIYGVRVETAKEQGGPTQGKPIKVVISGSNIQDLLDVTRQIRAMLEKIPGTMNVDDTRPLPGIEWNIRFDRSEVAKAGVTIDMIGTVIRLATNGVILDTIRPEGVKDEVDITARFKSDNRTLSVIDDLTIGTEAGQIPISHMVTRTAKQKVSTIKRLDQKNVFYAEADATPGVLPDAVMKQLKEELKTLKLPTGVTIDFKGEDKDQREAAEFLQKAFIVALFIMAIILVTQFNSYWQTFIILSAVILSTTGVLLGHILTMEPFGIVMSGLGVIALAGIVVNNNIVLIDTFNKLVTEMPDWREALVETARSRLRPVMLTAVTTMIGLLPMAAKINIDLIARSVVYNSPSTQWWNQLATSIIFGLGFATVLTLIVTPAMIALGMQRAERKKAAQARASAPSPRVHA